jgi:hypothetical protein
MCRCDSGAATVWSVGFEDVMWAWGERVFWRALKGARSDKIVWGSRSARRVFLACPMDRYRELNFKCIEILCGVVKHEVSTVAPRVLGHKI